MPHNPSSTCSAFEGHRLLRSGSPVEVALAVNAALKNRPSTTILVFDDLTGRVIDLDLRGSKADIVARLSPSPQTRIGRDRSSPSEESPPAKACEARGPGRPKLGVVSREVTLLPRHWEWLAAQPSGASATLRRLVDEARRNSGPQQQRRTAQEAAYRFMLGIAGDLPGYEEGTRALFADDRPRLEKRMADWPADIRAHVLRLAFGPSDRAASK
ncbi:MAG TPA: DUF2239 family protein [Steroidobacteraceae bacterium]|nr:DUF2239 family protein [Steroidobacteraceae bacterium]